MSKRAAAVQLTSDNYEQDDKDCDEVRWSVDRACLYVWWSLFRITPLIFIPAYSLASSNKPLKTS